MAKNPQLIQSIRGMHDILPAQSSHWQKLEKILKEVMESYCYQEIRLPIVEKTALFKRSIGEVTDIVEKEMYTFADRSDDSLTLRPEGTAGCLRACIEHGLLHNQTHKLWYYGPMFRYERPQKGRYRQFYQLGVEAYGMATPNIDAEIILITAKIWEKLKIEGNLKLELNTLGTTEERLIYREKLIKYFTQHAKFLDQDSLRRLHTNPLRILDSKNIELQSLLVNAPNLIDTLGDNSRNHFQSLTDMLDDLGIKYQLNNKLVRGLDYYGKTVFEWVTDNLGTQNTICAGGRYDNLIQQLGGKENYAIGFAIGIERLLLLLVQLNDILVQRTIDVYLIQVGPKAEKIALGLAERIRNNIPSLKLHVNCTGGSFKNQFKKADKSGAELALILGEDEVNNAKISLKPLRTKQEQKTLTEDEAIKFLHATF